LLTGVYGSGKSSVAQELFVLAYFVRSLSEVGGVRKPPGWRGRICTWPVLTTGTRRIGSFWFISVFLR
jgi:hypothetical protein